MKYKAYLWILCLTLPFVVIGCFDNESSPASPETNHKPLIESVTTAEDTINFGNTTTLTCIASDEDGDILSYTWTSDSGTFPDQNIGETVIWQAPNIPGEHLISVVVSDSDEAVCSNVAVFIEESFIPTPAGMVLIPSKDASFQMGSDNGFTDELPVHQVSLTYNFWMDITEVTQADYDDLMSSTYNGYFTPNWRETYGLGDDYPAYEVEWGDAVLYCNAKSKHDGLDTVYTYSAVNGSPGGLCGLVDVVTDFTRDGYRLPTEAEWEFACRANTETDFYWNRNYDPYPVTAADSTEISNYTIWSGNSWSFGIDNAENYGTHSVASKSPNGYGLYDMSGNVYEWINDWYEDYNTTAVTDPKGGENSYHFVRGGCWGNDPSYLRSANRTFDCPGYYYAYVGFRVVRTVQ